MTDKRKLATYLPEWIVFVLFYCWCLTLAAIHYVESLSKSANHYFLYNIQQWIGQTDMLHHMYSLNLKQFSYSCLHQINLIAYKKGDTNIIPDSLCPEVQTPAMSNTTNACLTIPKIREEGVTGNTLNSHATKNLKSNENKQMIKSSSASLIQHLHKNTDQDRLDVASFSPKTTTSMTQQDEWTLVNKKTKKTSIENKPTYPPPSPPPPPPPPTSKPAKKKKKKASNKKKCLEQQDKKSVKQKADAGLSWSCVAANAHPKTLTRDEPLPSLLEPSEADLPCLSDNDSITTSSSSGSPFLSSRHLPPPHFEEEKTRYYSPFSSGFDFGVTLQHKHQPILPKSTHSKSLLELLNQTDHVKTTMTPSSFRYFDDMMMSTSLYKTYQEPELDPVMIKIKQDWNSISYCT